MALSSDTTLTRREGHSFSFPQKGSTQIYRGAMVALDANGYAIPGKAADKLVCVGVAVRGSDNSSGADGAVDVEVVQGIYLMKSSDIDNSHVGGWAWMVDDETVSEKNRVGSVSRSSAGYIKAVTKGGAWIKFGK